ncbi:MAG: exosortase/archaeosortase family protein [Opitutus sp.]|nr:exosortase/archaeosortase family protein [Opitutus sp.]
MNSAAATVAPAGPLGRVSMPGKLAIAGLAIGMVALSTRLWPLWRHNPDLSHGMFMPVVFLLLLHEGRSGPARFLPPGGASRFGFTTFLTGGLLALIAAGLYAASVDWSHALVNLMLTLSAVLFLGAAVMVFARDSIRLIPCNWTIGAAIGLWLLSAPIPPGTYSRLTLGLQLRVSEGVLRSLHLLGVAAVRHGNIIDLANTSVGVEEACSGVRSLISCVFAAVFFSATLVSRPWARAVILILAAPIALVMNFIRSLTLTLLANGGVNIAGTWHDVTGFAVLGVTAIILGGLAIVLERGTKTVSLITTAIAPASGGVPITQWVLASALACAAGLVAFFVVNTRTVAPNPNETVPNLIALLPENAPGWQVKTENLYAFSGTLQTEHFAQRNYVRPTETGPVEIILYVAFWPAGQAPVSLVASHTPDACWPGSGWSALPTPDPRVNLTVEGRRLADAEHRLFQSDGQPQQVWFWHLYDGQPISYRDPYSAVELLRIAWRYGFRRGGTQLFVRVSSNRPWAEIAHDPIIAAFFTRTHSLGL